MIQRQIFHIYLKEHNLQKSSAIWKRPHTLTKLNDNTHIDNTIGTGQRAFKVGWLLAKNVEYVG